MRTLHEKGLAQAITAHHRAGKPLYGICGGYQMMGAEMRDPDGVEGDIASLPGLGILPVTTTLAGGKQTRRCSFVFTDGGAEGEGYEIHAGSTPTSRPLCRLNTGEDDGYYLNEATWGTYLHGIFNNASVINRVLRQVNTDVHAEADYRFDRLAQLIRDHVDVSYIYKTLEK